jgi:hypothetical protein
MTENQTPTLSQYKATAKHHRRMERVYREVGRLADAESAKKAAELLEAKIKELEQA